MLILMKIYVSKLCTCSVRLIITETDDIDEMQIVYKGIKNVFVNEKKK